MHGDAINISLHDGSFFSNYQQPWVFDSPPWYMEQSRHQAQSQPLNYHPQSPMRSIPELWAFVSETAGPTPAVPPLLGACLPRGEPRDCSSAGVPLGEVWGSLGLILCTHTHTHTLSPDLGKGFSEAVTIAWIAGRVLARNLNHFLNSTFFFY